MRRKQKHSPLFRQNQAYLNENPALVLSFWVVTIFIWVVNGCLGVVTMFLLGNNYVSLG